MDDVAPGTEKITVLQSTQVLPPTEAEVVEMLADETRFADEPALRETAVALLAAGYTVRVVARRLDIRASTVWGWSEDSRIRQAIAAGQERRRETLGQGLEEAADRAVSALLTVATDGTAAARDRIKASEAILDRCGMVTGRDQEQSAVAVSVDVDFDERLARIVAASRG